MPNRLLHYYYQMVKIRAFEQKLGELFSQGILGGTSHYCIGEEASAVGVVGAMAPTDWLVSNHRGHGHLLARDLDATRMFGELLGRENGYCRGKGGSQHLCCLDKHVLGTNGITGGGIPIGAGAALACKYRQTGEAVVVFFGDGASNQGTFHETLNMAALWKLPVLFVCENNLYGMSTPVAKSTAGGRVAPRAAAYQIPARTVNGLDIEAVEQATSEALAGVHRGEGPSLLELMTYRQCGHSKSDPRLYRSREEEETMLADDPLVTFPRRLRELGFSAQQIEDAEAKAKQEIAEAAQAAQQIPAAAPQVAVSGLFAEATSQPLWSPCVPPSSSPITFPGAEPVLPTGRQLYFSQAIYEALDEELTRDTSIILMGEDIGCYGGAFGVTKGLWRKYGDARIWETPISENSYTGVGVGAAMLGLRPVVEIMFMDFVALCLDQMLNSAAKLHYMYDGQVHVPMVLRTPGGAKGGYGPSHSQMLTNLYLGIPGLKVVAPSTAYQAKGLLKAAIRDENPVVFIENKRLYSQKGMVPEGDYVLPLDKAVLAAAGTDLTLISYSSMVPVCLAVREALLPHGVKAEVLDLVSLRPLDKEAILASVRKTGRAIIVEEGCATGGVGSEVASLLAAECLDALEAPVLRVGAKDFPIPSSTDLEKIVLPQAADIVEAIKKIREW